MSTEQIPPDSLYIRWGRFHAGASGAVAKFAVVAIAVVILMAWLFGLR